MTAALSDLATLHRAVLLHPDDTLARLAFADALEEQGDDIRAEFIRLQIRLDAPVGIDSITGKMHLHRHMRDSLPERVRETRLLFATHHGVWSGFPEALYPPTVLWEFRRGFIEEITLPLASFTEETARALFAAQPITTVHLSDRKPQRWMGKYHWSNHTADKAIGELRYIPGEICAATPEDTEPYESAEDAIAALSHACVVWGRNLVGLPPLPVEAL